MPEADSHQRRYLSRRARNALLTAHIMISVGLLGERLGFSHRLLICTLSKQSRIPQQLLQRG